VTCADFDHCATYNNGCNDCICDGSGGVGACTRRGCRGDLDTPHCLSCDVGFALNEDAECVPNATTTTSTMAPPSTTRSSSTTKAKSTTPGAISCEGFTHCASYNDGCNTCSCGADGIEWCTEMYCDENSVTAPYCISCDEGFTLNENAECVLKAVSCSDFDHCATYNNGCNNCRCVQDGVDACTFRMCPEESLIAPHCLSCADGFSLDDTGECIAQPTTTFSPTKEAVSCSDFEHCAVYHDGCNSCTCGGACTRKSCTVEMLTTPRCTACDDGFSLDENGECVPVTCADFDHCATYNNGCNDCICDGSGGVGACTRRGCRGDLDTPHCLSCDVGFALNEDAECVPNATTTTSTMAPPSTTRSSSTTKAKSTTPGAISCGDFAHCASYHDGCNTCWCGDHGDACTMMACSEEMLSTPHCLTCEAGFIINENMECVADTVSATCEDWDHCGTLFNGCNECVCYPNGVESCDDENSCTAESLSTPYCSWCQPGFTFDDTGACVAQKTEAPTTPSPTMHVASCSDFEHCAAYFNGCNDCRCLSGGVEACTWKYCSPKTLSSPECLECDDGFALNDDAQCVAASSTTTSSTTSSTGSPTPPRPNHVSCSDFDHCAEYSDGCNDCHCHGDKAGLCSKRWCPENSRTTPQCTQCEEGFELDEDAHCFAENSVFPPSTPAPVDTSQTAEPKKSCKSYRQCDAEEGFQCQTDLECLASGLKLVVCRQERVCVQYGDYCEDDEDCDEDEEYRCVAGGTNRAGETIQKCARYQSY